MRTIAVWPLCVLLCACVDTGFGPGIGFGGVVPPKTDEINSTNDELAKVGNPISYILTSLAITDERCDEFFKKLDKLKSDSSVAGDVINAAIQVATPLQATKVVQALTAANSVNTNLPKLYFFAEHSVGLHGHVREAMASYRQQHGLSSLSAAVFGIRQVYKGVGKNCVEPESEYDIPNGKDKDGKDLYNIYCFGSSKISATPNGNSSAISITASQMAVARSVVVNYAAFCTVPGIDDIVSGLFGGNQSGSTPGQIGDPAAANTKKSGI